VPSKVTLWDCSLEASGKPQCIQLRFKRLPMLSIIAVQRGEVEGVISDRTKMRERNTKVRVNDIMKKLKAKKATRVACIVSSQKNRMDN
jgi:hypothetical protein